jgi:uncharacterized repeat protein (TIGR02543 family)
MIWVGRIAVCLGVVATFAVAVRPAAAGSTRASAGRGDCTITQDRSSGATVSSTIQFFNDTDDLVDVYWLDYDGKRVRWFRMGPHLNQVQPTYIGHAWLVVDPTGACIGYTISRSPSQEYHVTPSTIQLTVTKTGNGTVASAPNGLTCGSACATRFPFGATVVLTARPDPGYPFVGWGGACSGTTPTCSVRLTATTTVEAHFGEGKVDGLATAFTGTWRRSLYSGSLSVSGTATRGAELVATISSQALLGRRVPQSRTIEKRFDFSVGQGAFRQSFRLPARDFWPGRYTFELEGTSGGTPILAQTATLKLASPKEGVVSLAWFTIGGKTVTTAVRGTKRLDAHFKYAAKPYIGSKVTVSWSAGGHSIGTKRKIRWKPVVDTYIASNLPLDRGRYTCTLRARGLVVYALSLTIT